MRIHAQPKSDMTNFLEGDLLGVVCLDDSTLVAAVKAATSKQLPNFETPKKGASIQPHIVLENGSVLPFSASCAKNAQQLKKALTLLGD